MKEPLIDIEVNCRGVINLLEAVRRFNPEMKFVHVGTSTQIGRMLQNPIDEFHPEFPLDIYSANKSVSEKYVLIYGKAYDIHTTVVRLVNTFGPRSMIKNSDFGFMNYFIGEALKNKEITIFGKGEQLRSYIYVEDAVNALITAAQHPKSKGEVFFAGQDNSCSVKEITEKITSIIGGSMKYIDWPDSRKSIEIGDAVISTKKIKQLLGWNPIHSLDEGLRKTKTYFEPLLKKYL